MKKTISTRVPIEWSRNGAFMLFVLIAFFSCRKSDSDVPRETNLKFEQTVGMMGGQELRGHISWENTKTGIGINYNNGEKYILIEKLPASDFQVHQQISRAAIAISDDGILLCNLENGEVMLFPDNNEESLRRFKKLESGLLHPGGYYPIYGYTVIREI